MKFLNDGRKYLIAIALVILIAFCGFFYYAFAHVNDALLREKIIDRKFDVDLICDQIDHFVELDNDWEEYDYRTTLAYVVAEIDGTVGTYAELFDKDMNGVSERTPLYEGAPFDPREYPELMEAIRAKERGEMNVLFDKGAAPHDMNIYFRWVPTDKTLTNRYLVIIGVTQVSVNTTISALLKYGAVALIVVAAIFIIGSVILLCRLGYIYQSRGGTDKWRHLISSSR